MRGQAFRISGRISQEDPAGLTPANASADTCAPDALSTPLVRGLPGEVSGRSFYLATATPFRRALIETAQQGQRTLGHGAGGMKTCGRNAVPGPWGGIQRPVRVVRRQATYPRVSPLADHDLCRCRAVGRRLTVRRIGPWTATRAVRGHQTCQRVTGARTGRAPADMCREAGRAHADGNVRGWHREGGSRARTAGLDRRHRRAALNVQPRSRRRG